MPALPEPITTLIAALARLPGIGPRSAERLALHLVQTDSDSVRRLAESMVQARERIRLCTRCGALTEAPTCELCTDPRRDGTLPRRVDRSPAVPPNDKSPAHTARGPRRFLKVFQEMIELAVRNKIDLSEPGIRDIFSRCGTADLYEKVRRACLADGGRGRAGRTRFSRRAGLRVRASRRVVGVVYLACEQMLSTALAIPGELERRRAEGIAAEIVM